MLLPFPPGVVVAALCVIRCASERCAAGCPLLSCGCGFMDACGLKTARDVLPYAPDFVSLHLRVFCAVIHAWWHARQMKRAVIYILLLLPFAVFVSCGRDGRVRDVLRTADSLLETRPDSALELLRRDSAVFAAAGRAVRMGSVLTRTEAEDKLYVTHRSDTAILPAAEYFSRRGPEVQSVRAWYLLGRVYYDMKLYGRALSAFDNALAVKTDSDSVVCRYKARAATWAGAVYEEKSLHSDALRYNKTAYGYARYADVPSIEVYVLRNIGRSYSNLTNNDTAIPYYLRASEKALALCDMPFYNMVMEELTVIYLEEGKLEEARKALSVPFYRTNDVDMAAHYFIWAMYFERIEQLDSAMIYNRRGMAYGDSKVNREAALDLARMFERENRKNEALHYYALYAQYNDSLRKDEIIENGEFFAFVKKSLDFERRSKRLVEEKVFLLVFVLFLIIIVLLVVLFGMRFYNRRKIRYELQQECVNNYWKMQHTRDLSSIRRNEERIKELEKELVSAGENLEETKRKLIRAEMDMLDRQNEKIISEQRYKDRLVAELENSDVYKKFHCQGACFSNDDFRQLKDALNTAYGRFVFRLEELYPAMRYEEMYVCCLVKIRLASKEICLVLDCKANRVSMLKTRLYQKMFKKKGSVADFDEFIRDF